MHGGPNSGRHVPVPSLQELLEREVRVVTYSQFLEFYKSVTMKSTAAAFNVGVEFLDKEISEFIMAGRLHAKIDKVAGVVETNRYARCAKSHELLCGFVFLAAGCFRSRHSIRHAYICRFLDAFCVVQS